MSDKILEMRNISKKYPGVKALDGISFSLNKGEVHALLGENGAGKSTLIKIITGAVQPSEGEIVFEGQEIKNYSPAVTLDKGIACIYQEFNLFSNLTIAENLFYGCEIKKGLFIDYKSMEKQSNDILSKLGMNINPKTLVKDLKVGQMQLVEIARALLKDVKVLIMDEPTASLTDGEIQNLFRIVKNLKESGVAIVYISHRLEEVFKISDRVTILRDGKHMITDKTDKFNESSLITYMVGRELAGEYPAPSTIGNEEVLRFENLTTEYIKNINFTLKKGEILGFAGLVGSGRTEVARALFGVDKIKDGQIVLKGEKVIIKNSIDAINKKIGFISEDRKNLGLILGMSVKENLSFSALRDMKKLGLINEREEKERCEEQVRYLNIKTPSLNERVNNLSGGNQQKVVIGKWLLMDCDILIFDEPTRGVDVGAKQEIYKIMKNLTEAGKSIIMISSEMPELIGMSHRIMVMSSGKIVSEYSRENVTQDKIFKDSAKER